MASDGLRVANSGRLALFHTKCTTIWDLCERCCPDVTGAGRCTLNQAQQACPVQQQEKTKGDLQGVAKNLRGVQSSKKLGGFFVEIDKLDSGYVLILTLADMAHFRL